ncbi:hypothetical protein [Desulfolithobacter dissulfuricans]|nr:hypothetical protein [Desulfolithobacter dissulfuricans]
MRDKRIIDDPLTEKNIAGLEMLEQLWGRHEVLRAQLGRLSKPRRQRLIDTAGLETKWERYAYGRYMNLENGQKLAMKQLIAEIEETYGFSLNKIQVRRLYQIREKIYFTRKKKKRGTVTGSQNHHS